MVLGVAFFVLGHKNLLSAGTGHKRIFRAAKWYPVVPVKFYCAEPSGSFAIQPNDGTKTGV
jgi:hypothetical protein